MTFEHHMKKLEEAHKAWTSAVNDAKGDGFSVKASLCGGSQYIYDYTLSKRGS